jgi:predicted permease
VTFPFDLAGASPNSGSFAGLIRARPGTSSAVVTEAVAAVGRAVDQRDFGSRGLRLSPARLADDLVAPVRPALAVLGMAAGFLLLVLAVNLATLLLARAAQREPELAVARALGANGAAITRATLFEGALLGTVGGAGAALLAVWATRAVVGLAPLDLPRRDTIAVDASIAAVVVAVGLVLGLAAASLPALWAARAGLGTLLGNAAVRGGGGHGRMRRSMVVVQVALSLVLLTAGGLVVRSFGQLLRADPGFDPSGVLTLRVPVPAQRYPNDTVVNQLHHRLHRALAALPGVTAVGAATALPLSAGASQSRASFPGAPGNTGDGDHDFPLIDYIQVRPGYFDALGIRIRSGRALGPATPGQPREAVISRQLGVEFFASESPLGRTMILDGDSLTVVGVAEPAHLYDVHEEGRAQVYLRNEDYTANTLSFVVRADRPPLALVAEAREAVGRVDPELALSDVRPMEDLVSESLREQRLSAVLIGGFSLGALLLTAMGIFGVVSSAVTRRRHELAVRLALGAHQGRVLRLVMGEGARLVAVGLLLAAPVVVLGGKALRGVLVGVSPLDPVTLTAVGIGLALVALAACYLPARRVTAIEPGRSLRQE